MKRISSKLILLTILLTAGLLLVTAYLSFNILKKESRAYTFQGQLLRTQLFSENLKNELSSAQIIAADLLTLKSNAAELATKITDFYNTAKHSNANFTGIGISLEGKEWIEYPAKSISSSANLEVRSKNELIPVIDAGTSSEAIGIFPAKNAMIAVRVDFKKTLTDCAGLTTALFNQSGTPIFLCNPEMKGFFESAKDITQKVLQMTLDSGAIENKVGDESYLITHVSVLGLGRLISATTAKSAYGPAYALGFRVFILILMAIGAAIVASIIVSRRVTGPIEEVTLATQKIAEGDFDAKINIQTQDETRTLANSVESMARKIKVLLKSEVEKAKLDAQLEVAGAVQRTLIPGKEVQFQGGVQVHSFYRPADQCGGDWWGYVSDGKRIAILIGDVSGHGYPSALLVATTRGFISMLQERIDREGEIRMRAPEMLQSLNGVVFDATQAELNMTAMCFIVDPKSGKFELASAGHNSAYQIAKESSSVTSLSANGARLGEMKNLAELPEIFEGQINQGDRLVFYTDGVQDLGPEGQPLGRKGFKKFLMSHSSEPAKDLVSSVERELYPLNEGRPLDDDITFVVLEMNP